MITSRRVMQLLPTMCGWVLATGSVTLAEVIHVPGDFATIQSAIDAAVDGDTRAPFEKRPRRRVTDAAARPGDQNRLVREVHLGSQFVNLEASISDVAQGAAKTVREFKAVARGLN